MQTPQQAGTKRSRKAVAAAEDDAPGPIPEDNLPGHQPDVVPDKPMVPPAPYRLHAVDDEVRGPVDDLDESDVSVTFSFLFDPLFLALGAPVGVLPQTTSLELDGDALRVRFGPWSLRTPRENIAGCEVTGPYKLWRVAGGPHLSLKDRGVTFATNARQGACIRFHEPVTGLLPWGLLRHPAATVTITNPTDLVRRLTDGE